MTDLMNVTRKMLLLRPDLQTKVKGLLLAKAVCRDCNQRQSLTEDRLTVSALDEDYCEFCFSSHLTYTFDQNSDKDSDKE